MTIHATQIDPYEVLGLSRSATESEIKSAFRSLAKQYHPDYNPTDKKAREKFSQIHDAYEILGDRSSRQIYDQTYTNSATATFSIERGKIHKQFEFNEELIPNPEKATSKSTIQQPIIFEDGLIGNTPPQDKIQPAQFETKVSIKLRDAAHGICKKIALPNGKSIVVDIPRGTQHGDRIIVQNAMQHPTLARKYTNVIVIVEHAPDSPFRLDNQKAFIDVPIAIHEALYGATITIPTFDGSVNILIPAGTTGRETLRVKNKGWPFGVNEFNDLYVNLKIILPDTIEELQSILSGNNTSTLRTPRGANFETL